jgi:hypothetical protein
VYTCYLWIYSCFGRANHSIKYIFHSISSFIHCKRSIACVKSSSLHGEQNGFDRMSRVPVILGVYEFATLALIPELSFLSLRAVWRNVAGIWRLEAKIATVLDALTSQVTPLLQLVLFDNFTETHSIDSALHTSYSQAKELSSQAIDVPSFELVLLNLTEECSRTDSRKGTFG